MTKFIFKGQTSRPKNGLFLQITGLRKNSWQEKNNSMNSCIDQIYFWREVKKMCFMFKLVMQRIQKCMISILMNQKLNIFNMRRILVVWLVWILICFLQMKMLQIMLLCINFYRIHHVTMLVLRIGSSLPVIFYQIVWETSDKKVAVTRLFRVILNHHLILLNDISDHLTLVELIDTAGNVNHTVSITGYWIYDSNYKRPLSLII